tara:strand:+ start:76 stop:243 length:168 start_codon:yes stop_codon:yes gene_type:complete
MLGMLFKGFLEASSTYYGDSVGLAPITFASKTPLKSEKSKDFWGNNCQENPSQVS